MPEYLLSVWSTEGEPKPEGKAIEQAYADVDEFNTRLQATGNWVFAGGLHAAETASVVDATGETLKLTDGPFAETKEQMGGFWVIKAADLDAALEVAKGASAACAGPVEVRPFQSE